MKKVRIFLSVFAIVLAVAGTFVAQSQSMFFVTAWEHVPAADEDPAFCRQVSIDCVTDAQYPCTLNSNPVGNSSTISNSMCGTQLRKTTP